MFKTANRKSQIAYRPGLGLIETIVGIGILVGGICVLMSMVVSAAASRSANEYATVAANLAREGIEVVVAKRNDNWINDFAFDNGMYDGTDYTFGLAFDPTTAAWSFYVVPIGINDASTMIYKYISPSPYLGLMVQATRQPAETVPTPYRRLVSLDCICYAVATDTERIVTSGADCGSDQKIGVRIASTVQWLDRGVSHDVSAVETIYDWR